MPKGADSVPPRSEAGVVVARPDRSLVTDDVGLTDRHTAGRSLAGPGTQVERTSGKAAPPAGRPTPTGPAAGPTVLHGPGGTAVTGTDNADTALREALKANGFSWSRREIPWYLRFTLPEHTRAMRVDQLRAAMAGHGRDLPVADNPHRRPAEVAQPISPSVSTSTNAPIRSDRAPGGRGYEL